MVVEAGDLVMGDDDGVLYIPFNQVGSVYDTARAKAKAELKMMADISAGTYDDTWVDAILNRLGCQTEQ